MKDFVRRTCNFCGEKYTRHKLSRRLFCSDDCAEKRQRERKVATRERATPQSGRRVSAAKPAVLAVIARAILEIAEIIGGGL